MLVLTNCTFDGIVYHPYRVMEECLKIKPDLIFHWDEAWFAYAGFSPTYRRRTAMDAARRLRERLKAKRRGEAPEDPLPENARVRVYATQSTHKTLTSLRQGSMIHVADQDFHEVEESYREAYMTHTSTSPNYQILASLDLGRRQAELEGFELVSKQVELALQLREQIAAHPLLNRWFRCLSPKDLIPEEHRPSGIEAYYDREKGWTPMVESWEQDEFALDPTRLTLYVGKTGVDGDTFKKRHLMERHGIQVNKTSRNSVLFMTNIGTTRSSVAHLIDSLIKIADEFDQAADEESGAERRARERRIRSLTEELPPLPDFSAFHSSFRGNGTPEGRMREAYFMAMDDENCDHVRLDDRQLDADLAAGREIVSAAFVTPYPPGFPILVPGEVIEQDILTYMRALDTKEIHGYRGDLGLRVFRDGVLQKGEHR
jgi:arginine decarboxylase